MPSNGGRLRRWLTSLVFCAGGAACQVRQPVAGLCPLPVRTLRVHERQAGGELSGAGPLLR